jgi:hypothetical protein
MRMCCGFIKVEQFWPGAVIFRTDICNYDKTADSASYKWSDSDYFFLISVNLFAWFDMIVLLCETYSGVLQIWWQFDRVESYVR